MSYTKADLSTEGRGPVCRVPIPTLAHFPIVISTTIPVAVGYRYINPKYYKHDFQYQIFNKTTHNFSIKADK